MIKIPELKKKISSFLTKEDGKISKDNLIKTSVLIAAFSIGAAMSAESVRAGHSNNYCNPTCGMSQPSCPSGGGNYVGKHKNDLSLSYTAPTAVGTHNHCIQSCHCSHSSHSSHGSHGNI